MIGLLPETGLDSSGELILPPGLAKGLNDDIRHPGKDCGFFKDISDTVVIPQEEWQPFIDAGLTLRHNSRFLFNQKMIGSCGSEGKDAAVEIVRDAAGLEPIEFNPYGTYYYVSGGSDRGSSLIDNMKSGRERGSFPASLHPRSLGWRVKPSAEAHEAALHYRIDEFYEVRNWVEFGSALLQRFAVYAGYSGHAWVADWLPNLTQVGWRNSWGTSWGDNGFGILNSSRIMWNYGCYAVRTTTST